MTGEIAPAAKSRLPKTARHPADPEASSFPAVGALINQAVVDRHAPGLQRIRLVALARKHARVVEFRPHRTPPMFMRS
jgi:hypothetical protein